MKWDWECNQLWDVRKLFLADQTLLVAQTIIHPEKTIATRMGFGSVRVSFLTSALL